MIINTISIPVFAGLVDRHLSFDSRINVITGPNEAGKSTVLNALYSGIFLPTKLTPKRFEQNLGAYLPISGGDTIGIDLDFTSEKESYTLTKRWGAGSSSVLELPTGGRVEDEVEVLELVQRMLPAPSATVSQLFFAQQSTLSATLARLKDAPEIASNLSELLRMTIFEASGVSVEGFRRLIAEEVVAYYLRWDRKNEGPEKGRGIENPWRQKIGRLLKGWYEREGYRKRVTEVKESERAIAELDLSIRKIDQEISLADEFLELHADSVKNAGRAAIVDAEIAKIEAALKAERAAYEEWPRLEKLRNESDLEIGERNNKLPALRAAVEVSTAASEQVAVVARLARVDSMKREIEAMREGADSPSITSEQIAAIRSNHTALEEAKRAISAGNVTISLSSYDNTRVRVTSDGEEREIDVDPLTGAKVSASGLIRLRHGELEMNIGAGVVDPADLEDRFKRASSEYEKCLAETGVVDLTEAEHYFAKTQRRNSRLEALERQLANELAGERYEEIAEAAKGAAVASQSVEEATRTLVQCEEQIKAYESIRDEATRGLDEMVEGYTDQDALFDRMTRTAATLDELSAEIVSILTLPEPFHSAQELISEHERVRRGRDKLSQERQNLALERERIDLPDESLEEIEEKLRESCIEFDRIQSRARAVDRIASITHEILDGHDRSLYSEIESHFSDYLASMTGNRYVGPSEWEALPASAIRSDEVAIAFDLLSGGTKDIFALALRLAIARYYLDRSEGFLILDDPLVDLDEERRRAVGSVLSRFGEKHQILLFTCHPGHAEYIENCSIHHL